MQASRYVWLGLSMTTLLLYGALAGCGDDDDSGAPDTGRTDTGAGDSAPPEDGAPADAGPREDSGPAVDSGMDMGPAADTGPGTDAGPIDSGPPAGACPAEAPADGAPCAREGLVCTFGDDPRPSCRPRAVCESGVFRRAMVSCDPLLPVACPSTREAAAGTPCTPDMAYCSYDGIACYCTNCTDGPAVMCSGDPTWHCDAPNPDPTCPAALPNVGTECRLESQSCTYGCEDGMVRRCMGGVWLEASSPGGCPVSTRRAKRGIEYLSPAERVRVAGELLSTRLATYEYTDPALRGRRHLGFILEDQPGSFASDLERSQVDLYGYASMLVATVQTQQEQIESLRRELQSLRRADRFTRRAGDRRRTPR